MTYGTYKLANTASFGVTKFFSGAATEKTVRRQDHIGSLAEVT